MSQSPSSAPAPSDEGWWSRERTLVVVLAAATAISLWICFRITQPFLPALAWALALAIVAHPLHRWIAQRISSPSGASAVAVAIVALAVIAPALFTGYSLGQEAGGAVGKLRAAAESGALQQSLQSQPRLAPVVSWANQQGDLGGQLQGLASEVTKHLGSLLGGSVMAIVQLLLTLFLLFYFFRDRSKVLATVRSLLPLSGAEADRLFSRVYETVHATIYGTVLVALVQGALGGLMFWWLGLPAPLLWGVVMALLAIVPVFGAFIIWIPAAIFLAMSGQWGKAMILTGWGAVVIGLVDNLLYPMFVGSKLRMHTVPVFIAIVGGLALFGGSGLVLGPVTLAVTIALVEVWRRRTAAGGTAEEGVHAPALARESALSAEPPKEHATQ